MTHAVDRAIEDRDVRAEAERDHRGVVADDSTADDQDAPGRNARHASEQESASAERLLEEIRAGLRGEASGDLAHRCEQRQRPGIRLDGLVCDSRDAALDERARERFVGRDVQIGEEDQAFA